MKNPITNRPPSVDATHIGSKKIEFQLELRSRFVTQQELDDIDTTRETIIDLIQQSASRVAKVINKPLKSRISSPTLALMMKRREMVENGDDQQRIEYAEICKTNKKKVREDIRKYNQEETNIKETNMASKSLRKVQRTQTLGQDRLFTLLHKQDREICDQDKIIYIYIRTYLSNLHLFFYTNARNELHTSQQMRTDRTYTHHTHACTHQCTSTFHCTFL